MFEVGITLVMLIVIVGLAIKYGSSKAKKQSALDTVDDINEILRESREIDEDFDNLTDDERERLRKAYYRK